MKNLILLIITLNLMDAVPDTVAATSQQGFFIRNVTVVDGTGSAGRLASVRIAGDRIVDIGQLSPVVGETVIDGDGSVLAPGFIDSHSHHDEDVLGVGDPTAILSQGITTVILGQDGDSHYPLGEFFAEVTQKKTPVNVASYSGHNSLRREVMGENFRRKATIEEVGKMRNMLANDMATGAIGLSTGLEYDPGIYSTTTEVIMLAREAAKAGGRYISHIRSEDTYHTDAIEEIILIGRETGMPVQISHIKLARKGLWGTAGKLVARLEAARAEGITITADIYPYTYWSSTMEVLIPDRDFENRNNFVYALGELAPPEGLYLVHYAPDPGLVDKSFAEIAKLKGTDPVTLYMELIKTSRTWRSENPEGGRAEGVVGTSMHEDDIKTLMSWAHTNICSDGSSDGGHPRGWGAFPRVLGKYVRENGVLALEQAIHKMSLLSARHMGIQDRGVIRKGAFADLVLFNPDTVIDNARIGKRAAMSGGIRTVWVNGKVAFENGKLTNERPGLVLRREN